MVARTSSGTSRRSFSFAFGMMISRRPARYAASVFSFTPPISSTLPRSVTSPVIATSRRTGRSLSTLAIASVTATPALGPSFGMAPAGKWMCRSKSRKTLSSIPSGEQRERTYE